MSWSETDTHMRNSGRTVRNSGRTMRNSGRTVRNPNRTVRNSPVGTEEPPDANGAATLVTAPGNESG